MALPFCSACPCGVWASSLLVLAAIGPALVQIARKIADAGLEIIATSGTLRYLSGKGFDVTEIKKVHDGSPNVIDLMRKEDVGLVINTPTSRMSYKDGRGIRRAAVD